MTRFTRTLSLLALASSLALLSCVSSSKQQTPPPAGGTGWTPGDPLTTSAGDGTPVVLPPAPDAGAP
ncbi:MAG: hypothetical protein ACXWK5_01000 [Myxococcaceae bacterium]